jgi:hypothetical protein
LHPVYPVRVPSSLNFSVISPVGLRMEVPPLAPRVCNVHDRIRSEGTGSVAIVVGAGVTVGSGAGCRSVQPEERRMNKRTSAPEKTMLHFIGEMRFSPYITFVYPYGRVLKEMHKFQCSPCNLPVFFKMK